MTVKKVITLAFGVLFIGMSIFEITKTPTMATQIDDAVYLEAPVLDPANDGKTVVIHGKVELIEPAYDDTFGITLNAPRICRDTREYSVKKRNGEIIEDWKQKSVVYFTGKAKIGEFKLDDELLRELPLKHGTAESDFDIDEIGSYYRYTANSSVYFSDGRLLDTDIGIYDSYPANGDGQLLFNYKICDADRLGEVTVIGIQQGDTLKYVDGFSFASVVEGEMDKTELFESQKDSAKTGAIVFAVIGLILLFFGFKGVLYLK